MYKITGKKEFVPIKTEIVTCLNNRVAIARAKNENIGLDLHFMHGSTPVKMARRVQALTTEGDVLAASRTQDSCVIGEHSYL